MAKAPPQWVLVDDEQVVRELTDRKLRRMIREHDLDGHELVRAVGEGEDAFRPLHTLTVYQQVHGVGPEEAEVVAHAHRVRGFVYHVAAFFGVLALLGPQFWFAFWGIGVAAHFSRVAPSLARLRATGKPLGAAMGFHVTGAAVPAPAVVAPAGQPASIASPEPSPSAPSPDHDPLERQLVQEWARVQELVEGTDSAAPLQEAWTGVEGAVSRRRRLLATLDGESEEALAADVARLEAEALGLDAVTAEALGSSRRAVEARLDALRAARTAELRLRARVEAMLHQLKAVRLSLVARPDPTGADLEAQVGALRSEARAAAELEEALASARSPDSAAARARQRS